MTSEQIQSIVDRGRFPGQKHPVEWLETHISWVILTPEYVFKIKKPVQFSFLDFSTPEKRAFYCLEEVHLNRRLAPAMYLNVVPITLDVDGLPEIGAQHGKPLDMAVWMRRMDNTRQMDKMLLRNAVDHGQMESLAKVLAGFHRQVVIPSHEVPYRPGDNRSDFDDLFRLENVCIQLFGASAGPKLAGWRKQVGALLDVHEPRLHARARSGFWVDGHGDLHGRNIFLLPNGPVVFDCIEFNPHFRRLDVLNELAFLCMDLEASGHYDLAGVFMGAYQQNWPCLEVQEDEQLFQYFKAYRANVRLKVTLMEWQQHNTEALEKSARTYWNLLDQYLSERLS